MKRILLTIVLLSVCILSKAQTNITLVSQLSYPGLSFAGMWHYIDPLGNQYALNGSSDGVRIIDVTNPALPVQVASVPGQTSIWREIKTYQHYAYVSTESANGVAGATNGLQIIDLAGLPNSISYKYYSDSLLGSLLMRGHTVTVADNGYLYVSGTHLADSTVGGVLIFSLADPWNPAYVGRYTQHYVHDCIVFNDTMISSELGNGFAIVDVSNKANPVLLQTQTTPAAFNHNSWRSDNGNILFTADEVANAPLASYDISDINNIKLLDTYLTENTPSGEVHNVRVRNDFLICPSYGSKVTVVDAARPDNLIEVGWYPTSGFLCWDADPYLPSGNLLVNDMNGNFYVLAPNYIRACYLEGVVTDSTTGAPLNNALIQVAATTITDSTNLSGVFKTGTVNAGAYTVTVSLNNYLPQTFNVTLANGVLTTLNVQLVPLNAGISNQEIVNNLLVTPNPVNATAEVILPDYLKSKNNLHIKVYNALGKQSQQLKMINDKFLIQKSNFPTGVYFFEVAHDTAVVGRGKFVID